MKILKCPRCSYWFEWVEDGGPPGECTSCGGAREPWVVLKERPPIRQGFVRLLTDKGWTEVSAGGGFAARVRRALTNKN